MKPLGKIAENTARSSHRTSGVALYWILLIVALLAALTYAFTQGMRQGQGSISQEKIRLLASELFDYSRNIKQAIQTLRISGCAETEINFDTPALAGYANAGAPADNSCNVFNLAGGALHYKAPSSDINGGLDWIFTGANDGENVGTHCNAADCADLIAIAPDISENICIEINTRLNIAAANNYRAQEADSVDETKFQGTYTYAARYVDGAPQYLEGKMAGCFEGNAPPQSAGKYYFYQVLIAR